jgi:hypothetical protein
MNTAGVARSIESVSNRSIERARVFEGISLKAHRTTIAFVVAGP